MSDIGPGEHTRVRRMPQLARYDERSVFAVLDAAPFVHLCAIVDGRALGVPMLAVRDGHVLYLHASASNAIVAAALAEGEATVSAVCFDGLRLARSGFESSAAYRSVIAMGPIVEVSGDEAARALDLVVDRLPAGRAGEVRPVRDRERRLTRVARLEIREASAKLSAGPTEDDEEDRALELWSGVVPAYLRYGSAIPALDGAMAERALALPPSVRALSTPVARNEALANEVRALSPVDHRESVSIAALLDRLDWGTEYFDESADPRHVTASAFVVSARGVILHRHRHLGIWVQPGGHVDAGEEPLHAALREVREETGLECRAMLGGAIFHVDLHQGPRGHTHYDLRYVVRSEGADPSPGPGESPEVFWFSFDEAPQRAEPALRAALVKLARWASTLEDGTL